MNVSGNWIAKLYQRVRMHEEYLKGDDIPPPMREYSEGTLKVVKQLLFRIEEMEERVN